MNPNSLYDSAEALLDLINTVYMEYSAEVAPLPLRQIIVAGGPSTQPHDCEQVVVYVSDIYPGEPNNQDWNLDNCGGLKSASFAIELVRKASPLNETVNRRANPSALTAAQENDIAKTQLQDMRMLFETGLRAGKDLFLLGASVIVNAGAEAGLYQSMTLQIEGSVS